MKRSLLFLPWLLCLGLLLGACTLSRPVLETQTLIRAIGEVTEESLPDIERAEAAYASLSEAEQGEVNNVEALISARARYDALLAERYAADPSAALSALPGVWRGEADATQALRDALGAYVEPGDLPEELHLTLPVLLTLRDDGSFVQTADAEGLLARSASLRGDVRSALLHALGESYRRALSLSEGDSLDAALTARYGSDLNILAEEYFGVPVDSFCAELMESLLPTLSDALEQRGVYRLDGAELRFTPGGTLPFTLFPGRLSLGDAIFVPLEP